MTLKVHSWGLCTLSDKPEIVFCKPSEESFDVLVQRLASLPPHEYEKRRKKAADDAKVRVSFLDQAVYRFKEGGEESNGHSIVETISPYKDPIDGKWLIENIEKQIHFYCVLPKHSIEAISLWIVATYCFDQFRIFPKLCINSPQKRCGKSTLMEVIDALAHSSLMASNISPAVIYRVIDKYSPTLILDEADTWLVGKNSNDEMRGIINSGHSKKTANVVRCVGDDHEPKAFSTWSPMVIGMIGEPPATIADRSITIRMRRKTNLEQVSKLHVDYKDKLQDFRSYIKRWALDNLDQLASSTALPPPTSNDRAFDNWTPLFQLANTISNEYAIRLSESFSALMVTPDDEEDAGIMLLSDIKHIFEKRALDRLSSFDLVRELVLMDDRPWKEWKRGSAMSQNTLSRLLKPFNIRSNNIRFSQNEVRKGYTFEQFKDAFLRYIPK